jgi:hypothetical protein
MAQHLRILSPVPASMPSMASSMPSVETTAMGAAAMKEGMGSRNSSVARPSVAGPAGGAGMPSRRRMQVAGRVGRPMPAGTPAIKMVAMIHLSRMEIIAGRAAIHDASTTRDEALMVEDGPATMPITSPMVPTPAVAGE